MKVLINKVILTVLCVCFIFLSASLAQEPWMKPFENTDQLNFYAIQNSFYSTYHKQYSKYLKAIRHKGKGEKEEEGESSFIVQFKRWESFWQPRVNADGSFPPANAIYKEWKSQLNTTERSTEATANWTSLGPSIVPSGTGSGRLNVVRFDPNNSNKIFAGSGSGGLWVSTNGGSTWNTTTDLLPSIGVTDAAIDPANSNTIYIATGDGDASDTYSVGIMKSTDGGLTWDTTGLTWSTNNQSTVSRLLINPDSSNVLLAATSTGIYKSEDSGTTWKKTFLVKEKDMAFMPYHSKTIYACSTSFLKSVDGGSSWKVAGTGLPTANVVRIAIAVSKADSNLVLALVSDAADYGLLGLYQSTDAGNTFTLLYNSLNLLGWASNGGDVGGQGWYDLTLAVSQYTTDTIFTGGVNVWRSTNGGKAFSLYGFYAGPFGGPYVHADDHFLTLSPNSKSIYLGCDGGIYSRAFSSTKWTDLSNNLSVMQIYSLSGSATNANVITTGAQDNGTCKTTGVNDWNLILGGDGMQTIVDYANDNIIYGEGPYGAISVSSDGGNNFTNIPPNSNALSNWVTPYVMDPNNDNILYAGLVDIYKTTDYGSSWTNVTNSLTGGNEFVTLAVAPSNSNVVYAATNNKIYKSNNAGATWKNTNGNLPSALNIACIAVKSSDPNTVWVTYSGFNSSEKVYKSVDSGATWTNISSGLPAIPANCIVYQNNSNDDLYVGTDLGVYYINANMSKWVPYNDGLPNVVIDQLNIQYSSNELRAATYGRGVWETNPVTATTGIQQVSDNNSDVPGINIYPNPASDYVTILFSKNYSAPILISMYNVLGQMEMQSSLASATSDQTIQLDISRQSKGIHFIKVSAGNQVIAIQKLVIIN